MSQPHHALLFIMTALPWQCLLQTSLLAAVAAAESCLKVRGDVMDRASTIRFYDHYGHISAAVCYQNTLHARTGDGRLDHARTHEPRGRKGVNGC